MRWLWFVGSVICFAVVFRTPSMGLAVLCLIGALGFMLMGVISLASARIDARSRDASALLGPDEIRRVREAAQRRGDAGSASVGGVVIGAPVAAGGLDAPPRKTAPHHEQARDGRHDSHDDGSGGEGGGDSGGGDGGGGGD